MSILSPLLTRRNEVATSLYEFLKQNRIKCYLADLVCEQKSEFIPRLIKV
jgi:hypothetical protein